MEDYKINADRMPHLLKVTADLFKQLRNETKAPNDNPILTEKEGLEMHFIADLLISLVETVHPPRGFETGWDLTEGNDCASIIEITTCGKTGDAVETKVSPLSPETFQKTLEKISELMKNQKPPKGGIEF